MKVYLTLFLFLFFAKCTEGKASLTLMLSSCKTDSIKSFYSVNIYKDGTYFKTIELNANNNYDTTIIDLSFGVYNFVFTNIFSQQVIDTIKIFKDSSYSKYFCSDNFLNIDRTFRGYIDSLSDKEFFSIEFESSGCYHSDLKKIKILKVGNDYFATIYPTKDLMNGKTERRKKRTVILNKEKFEALTAFEVETFNNATGVSGSTETTYYTFVYKKVKLRFIDNSESRSRFLTLEQILFGSRK